MTEKRQGALFIRNMPTDLRDTFKAYCAQRGTNMTEKIVELIKQTIADDNMHAALNRGRRKPKKKINPKPKNDEIPQ